MTDPTLDVPESLTSVPRRTPSMRSNWAVRAALAAHRFDVGGRVRRTSGTCRRLTRTTAPISGLDRDSLPIERRLRLSVGNWRGRFGVPRLVVAGRLWHGARRDSRGPAGGGRWACRSGWADAAAATTCVVAGRLPAAGRAISAAAVHGSRAEAFVAAASPSQHDPALLAPPRAGRRSCPCSSGRRIRLAADFLAAQPRAAGEFRSSFREFPCRIRYSTRADDCTPPLPSSRLRRAFPPQSIPAGKRTISGATPVSTCSTRGPGRRAGWRSADDSPARLLATLTGNPPGCRILCRRAGAPCWPAREPAPPGIGGAIDRGAGRRATCADELRAARRHSGQVANGTVEDAYLGHSVDSPKRGEPPFRCSSIELLMSLRNALDDGPSRSPARGRTALPQPANHRVGWRHDCGRRRTVEMHAARQAAGDVGLGAIGELLKVAKLPVRSIELDVMTEANATVYWLRRRTTWCSISPSDESVSTRSHACSRLGSRTSGIAARSSRWCASTTSAGSGMSAQDAQVSAIDEAKSLSRRGGRRIASRADRGAVPARIRGHARHARISRAGRSISGSAWTRTSACGSSRRTSWSTCRSRRGPEFGAARSSRDTSCHFSAISKLYTFPRCTIKHMI